MLAGYDHLLAAGRRLQWDAEAIDLSRDRSPSAAVKTLVAGFLIAENAVAEHLDPYIAAAGEDPVARECFALQQGDERRHARFFARVAALVGAADPPPAIEQLFTRELPAMAAALASGEAGLGDAVGLYHLILEGVVFAAGQQLLLDELDRLGTLPGTREGVARVQADERWHVGLGVMALQGRPVPELTSDGLLALAASAWGDGTPVEAALAAHARRLTLLRRGRRHPDVA